MGARFRRSGGDVIVTDVPATFRQEEKNSLNTMTDSEIGIMSKNSVSEVLKRVIPSSKEKIFQDTKFRLLGNTQFYFDESPKVNGGSRTSFRGKAPHRAPSGAIIETQYMNKDADSSSNQIENMIAPSTPLNGPDQFGNNQIIPFVYANLTGFRGTVRNIGFNASVLNPNLVSLQYTYRVFSHVEKLFRTADPITFGTTRATNTRTVPAGNASNPQEQPGQDNLLLNIPVNLSPITTPWFYLILYSTATDLGAATPKLAVEHSSVLSGFRMSIENFVIESF